MKFNVRKFAIILVSIVAASFLISGILFYATGGIKSAAITSGQIKTNESFKTEGIEKIVINTVNSKIRILPSEGKDIIADFYGSIITNLGNNSPKLITGIKDGTLNISISHPKTTSIGLFDVSNLFLDIYMPLQFANEVNATSVSGEINIEGFNGKRLMLKTISGNINAKSIKTLEIKADSVSGTVNLENVEGNLKIFTISGEVNTGVELLSEDILIETTSGTIKLALPSASEFGFDLESISGDIKNNFDSKINIESGRSLQGNSGEGKNKIKMTTVSGNITIVKE